MITWISNGLARVNSCTTKLAASTWIKHAAIALQRGPEPAGPEFLIGGRCWTVPSTAVQSLQGNCCGQLVRLQGHHALVWERPASDPAHCWRSPEQSPPAKGSMEGTCSRVPAPAGTLCRHHMESKARRQLTTELEVGGEPTTEIVLQDLLDRIPPERQLHQLRQHLETSQGFLEADRRHGSDADCQQHCAQG